MNPIESLIDRYAIGGPILSYATMGLTLEQEQARPGPGAWSIAELVSHLVDSDLVAADRMKRLIAEENPSLVAFDEEAWISRLGSHEMLVEEGVNLFTANRHWMTRVLRRCSVPDFGRAGQHSQRGRVTLAEVLSTFTNHLDHHLKFLYAKRANLGVSLQPRYTYEPSN
jgi:hypothetical protein